ncbi:g3308 [Coccomyxa elongata]
MAAVHSEMNHGLHDHYEDSDEEVLLSDPSEDGDGGERTEDDYDYSPSREEHFEDAEGEEDFKSVQDDLELRHAEDEARVTALLAEQRAIAQHAEQEPSAISSVAFEQMGDAQKHAIRQLNILKYRKSDLNLSVLEGFTEDNLHTRIGAIFQEHVAHFSDNDVNNLAEDLLPVVKQLESGSKAHRSTEATEGASPSVSKLAQEHAEPSGKPEALGAAANGHSEQSPTFSTAPQSPDASKPSEEGSKSPINVDALFKQAAVKYGGSAELQKPAETSKPAEAVKENTSTSGTEDTKAPAGASPRSAMPSLPARPAARGSAMPSLPARPARTSAGPPASAGPAPSSKGTAMPSLPPRTTKVPTADATPVPAAPAAAEPKQQQPPAAQQAQTGNTMPWSSAQQGAPNGAQNGGDGLPNRTGAPAGGRAPPSANGGAISRSGPGAGGNPPGGNQGNIPAEDDNSEAAIMRRKVLGLHVLLLRIALRLGQNPRSSLVQQVVYRLDLAESIRAPTRGPRRNPFETALAEAERQEAAAGPPAELPFSATILCVGITGVGKTATIHSVLGLPPPGMGGFEPQTKQVRVLEGAINGIRVRFIDTPGLQAAASAVGYNARVLSQIRKAHRKYKPDNVLYFDRMDQVRRDQSDIPVLRALTNSLGAAMWFNCILVLTHAAAAPPDNNNGPMTYDVYANQRCHTLQQAIRFAAGDQRLMNPLAPAENHPNCRRNAAGEPVLPSGNPWKQQMLLLCLSSKILSDADNLLKISATNTGPASRLQQMLRGQRLPPIPHLLSVMVQPKQPRKYPEEERDIMREDEIAALPTEEERRREMRKRREFLKMRREEAKADDGVQVAIPAPDPPLPPTFDADVTAHRYRFLEQPGGWLARPFVEPTGLDHDDGIDGLSTERSLVLRRKGQYLGGIPVFAMAQMQKDKNQQMLNADVEASVYHNARLVSTGALDVMTTQRDLIYTARAETRVKIHPRDKAALGITIARLVEEGGPPTKGPVAIGAKVENRIKLHKKAKLVSTLGRMTCKTRMGRENATAGQAELKLRLGDDQRSQVVAGTSFMNFRNDMAIAGNLAAQFSPTSETQVVSRCSLNSKSAGSVSMRVTSHDYPQLGYSLIVPVASAIINRIRGKDMY